MKILLSVFFLCVIISCAKNNVDLSDDVSVTECKDIYPQLVAVVGRFAGSDGLHSIDHVNVFLGEMALFDLQLAATNKVCIETLNQKKSNRYKNSIVRLGQTKTVSMLIKMRIATAHKYCSVDDLGCLMLRIESALSHHRDYREKISS